MCKLCEKEKETIQEERAGMWILVSADRLAVLEHDHLAMERLRNKEVKIVYSGGHYIVDSLGSHKSAIVFQLEELADAILAVGEK
jgi:hypothetical protein